METRTRWYAALSLLLAACGPAAGPESGPGAAVTPLTLEPPPIYSLLGFRSELVLESGQIARLDSIANWIRDENAPLVDSLQALGGQAQNRRGLVENEATSGLLEQVRANNRRAGEAVGEVLTQEQREAVCRLYDRGRRGEQARREQARREERARDRGTEPDSTATRSARLWPWCAGTAVEADSATV